MAGSALMNLADSRYPLSHSSGFRFWSYRWKSGGESTRICIVKSVHIVEGIFFELFCGGCSSKSFLKYAIREHYVSTQYRSTAEHGFYLRKGNINGIIPSITISF